MKTKQGEPDTVDTYQRAQKTLSFLTDKHLSLFVESPSLYKLGWVHSLHVAFLGSYPMTLTPPALWVLQCSLSFTLMAFYSDLSRLPRGGSSATHLTSMAFLIHARRSQKHFTHVSFILEIQKRIDITTMFRFQLGVNPGPFKSHL